MLVRPRAFGTLERSPSRSCFERTAFGVLLVAWGAGCGRIGYEDIPEEPSAVTHDASRSDVTPNDATGEAATDIDGRRPGEDSETGPPEGGLADASAEATSSDAPITTSDAAEELSPDAP